MRLGLIYNSDFMVIVSFRRGLFFRGFRGNLRATTFFYTTYVYVCYIFFVRSVTLVIVPCSGNLAEFFSCFFLAVFFFLIHGTGFVFTFDGDYTVFV